MMMSTLTRLQLTRGRRPSHLHRYSESRQASCCWEGSSLAARRCRQPAAALGRRGKAGLGGWAGGQHDAQGRGNRCWPSWRT
eukprot:351114-Chlamydomonas_euryale.AAC.3